MKRDGEHEGKGTTTHHPFPSHWYPPRLDTPNIPLSPGVPFVFPLHPFTLPILTPFYSQDATTAAVVHSPIPRRLLSPHVTDCHQV